MMGVSMEEQQGIPTSDNPPSAKIAEACDSYPSSACSIVPLLTPTLPPSSSATTWPPPPEPIGPTPNWVPAGYVLSAGPRTQSRLNLYSLWGLAGKSLAQSDVFHRRLPSDVRHVILAAGSPGGLRSGGVIIDMTTSDPSLAVEIHSAASSSGCSSVDAPVSGGDRGARLASLSIFTGGDETLVTRLTPLLNHLGRVYYMGGPGKGQFCKLANQVTIASTMVGLCEGLIYAHKAGLDLSNYLNAISTGAAGSKSLDLYGNRILKRDFEAGFYVNHFVKDLGICLRECQNMGLALPGLALAQQLYLSLKAHGEGDLGTQALVLALERLNNVSLESGSSKSLAEGKN
ncbi:UNVERIFIED_CONTAM: putative 3-hydroxyisobutyrate dehydrogenase-like 1, mitochondrial [Sesamum radiatum]|uniref:3-hydroxyisobutyrate dehydrogenase-like 1, mitochondrial n=1 Tax=Sesamum radiatum TaxID=300843 RepID=A0AAW2R3L1_SESRA